MNSIKHIIFWLSVAMLFTGCTGSETIDEPKNPNRALTFSGYCSWHGSDISSRGSLPTLFAPNDSIIVYATYTDNPADNSFTSNFMKKQFVKFDGETWTYSPIKYWPHNGKLTFRGYYPATVGFDEKNHPNDGLLYTTHKCITGFEPLYAVEAVVNADNSNLSGAVSPDGKLQLGFTPLLNTINFNAKADDGLFDEVPSDEYTDCYFLLLNFKLWGFYKNANFIMRNPDPWSVSYTTPQYIKNSPLDMTASLVKSKVSEAVPYYTYNPSDGYCIDSAVVIREGAELINIFNKTLHMIPRSSRQTLTPGIEIQYVVLTKKVDNDGHPVYKESGIVTRTIALPEILKTTGQIKKIININLDFSIDGVTVTRNLEDYYYKPMF